jgi:hypothetical protein
VKDKPIKRIVGEQIRNNLDLVRKRFLSGNISEKYKKDEGMMAEKAKLILTERSLNDSSLNA